MDTQAPFNLFYIQPRYLVSQMDVRIVETADKDKPIRMTSTKDHPEFQELRQHLADNGFISMVKQCWNADRVLKPFQVNGLHFDVGYTFPCASALGTRLRVVQRNPELYA